LKIKKNILHNLYVISLLFSFNITIASELGNESENLKQQKHKDENYKALGGNIFTGYGLLKGNISEYISNPIFLGINVDILTQKLVMQIDCYIGFGKTKKTMEFPNNLEWIKNKAALHFILGGNCGYSLVDSKALKIVPLAGIGANLLSSTFMGTSDNVKNEPFLPFYKIGCYVDIKHFKLFKNNYSFNYGDSYTCIRLSFGINSPIGTPKYESYYKGNMFYFTIGMGGLGM